MSRDGRSSVERLNKRSQSTGHLPAGEEGKSLIRLTLEDMARPLQMRNGLAPDSPEVGIRTRQRRPKDARTIEIDLCPPGAGVFRE